MQLWRISSQPYRLLLIFAVFTVSAAFAEAPHTAVRNTVEDKIRPALARRMQAAALAVRQAGAPPLTHRIVVSCRVGRAVTHPDPSPEPY